ncbi:MAG: DegT/DnrJ/EryC1/StrS aminotransferase family protein [Candidatus Thermoplasmatota archaeon]|nr:DegT/DnrJ/EryC1/StrS aminotransferase family protein [Candidatus Thermoplasmatota archaeon]
MIRPFKKPISCELSPNSRNKELLSSLWFFLFPPLWLGWTRGRHIKILENYFKKNYHAAFARTFDNGRSALQIILQSLNLQKTGEVFIQGFTCIVVPNSVIAASGKPVYVDIDSTFNIDPEDLEKKIKHGNNPRAVVIQHTFGHPADIERIKKICQTHKLVLIEDCAHGIDIEHNGKKLGTFGDAAMFSFGRDKAISSVSGGIAITNNPKIGQALNRVWKGSSHHSMYWTVQRLLHPFVFRIAKRTYFLFYLGRVIIHLCKWLGIVPLVLSEQEKNGVQPSTNRLPNVLAYLAYKQILDIEKINQHRIDLCQIYEKDLHGLSDIKLPKKDNAIPYLRYPILVTDAQDIIKQGRLSGIYFGNWYNTVLAPEGCNMNNVQYVTGSCPQAEKNTKHIINLPTNIQTSQRDAQEIVDFISKFYSKK